MIGFCEATVLTLDPFEGDETDVSDLTDLFVVGRKAHVCHTCAGPIAKGERHRAKTERNNEESKIATFRFCRKCCASMAAYNEYDETTDRYNDDYELRMRLGECRRHPGSYESKYLVAGMRLPETMEAELRASEALLVGIANGLAAESA